MRRLSVTLASLLLLLAVQVFAGNSYLGRFEIAENATYVGSETCLDCHEDVGEFYANSPHAPERGLTVPGTNISGCEACHGPGSRHIEEEGDGYIIGVELFSELDEDGKVEMCVQCHLGQRVDWMGGPHAGSGIGCAECHADQVHFGGDTRPAHQFSNPSEFCLQCHTEQIADFRMPFRHRVLEGEIECRDCHDPHAGPRETGWNGANDACLNCHTEMAGPFVFEHEGVADEDCATCHRPHGSMHDKLLITDGNTMCLQCHYDIQFNQDDVLAIGGFPHGDVTGLCSQCHPSIPSGPSPHVPAGGEARCTDCHYEIHGSNVSATFKNQ